MTTVATITLGTLRCIRESDLGGTSHSEPYIWPALASVATNPLSFDFTPLAATLAESRYVIQSEMRAGDSATIPYPVNTLIASFDDAQTSRQLILVVALWEQDDTPTGAVQAGYQAFLTELHTALGNDLLSLSQADPAARAVIVDGIKKSVYDKVYSAESDALSDWDKTKVYFGWLNLDDFMGSDFNLFADVVPSTFVLHFKGYAGDLIIGNIFANPPTAINPPIEYEIDGTLDVQTVAIDPCQDQVDAVAAAQAALQGLEDLILGLQLQLQHAAPQAKAAIVAEISDVAQNQIPAAEARLASAKTALKRCRLLGAIRPPSTHPLATPVTD